MSASLPLEISDSEFSLISKLLEEVIGLSIKGREKRLVINRLCTRLHELGFQSYFEYYRYVTEGPNQQTEISQLVDALTTNQTLFFRHLSQFEHFRDEILPELVVKLREGQRSSIRIWSAGCSTGEEPYTLALLLMDHLTFGLHASFKIDATDVSTRALECAMRAQYSARRLEELKGTLVERYFQGTESGDYRLQDRVRRLVDFKKHNLNSPVWGVGNYDVIFCRNVLYYFQPPKVLEILQRFHRHLVEDGILCLGQTECLPDGLEGFERLSPSTYRKRR